MSTTAQKVRQILDTIHHAPLNGGPVSAARAVAVFRQGSGETGPFAGADEYGFDMNELSHWREKNNLYCRVPYYRPLFYAHKWVAPFIIFMGKLVRRVTGYYLVPVFDDQNRLNGSLTASINALANNDIVTKAFIAHTRNRLAELTAEVDALKFTLEAQTQKKSPTTITDPEDKV